MIWATFRAGRRSARPGGSQQQPKTWGWPARLCWLGVFGILLAHWWKFTVFFLLPLTVLTLIVALCATREQAAKRREAGDALDRAMQDLRASKDAPK